MSRMWINKKNKKENVNKASCWILAVIFAVVVFGSAGLAAADEEESKEIPVLRIAGNVYDESGANRWYTEEPKVEVCLDFVKTLPGRIAVITSLKQAEHACEEGVGTKICSDRHRIEVSDEVPGKEVFLDLNQTLERN